MKSVDIYTHIVRYLADRSKYLGNQLDHLNGNIDLETFNKIEDQYTYHDNLQTKPDEFIYETIKVIENNFSDCLNEIDIMEMFNISNNKLIEIVAQYTIDNKDGE